MKCVLIVDDQPQVRELVRLTLESEPYEVHEASDAVSGLAAARRLRPALVLLDVLMPGTMDGVAMCRALRADPALRHLRIVLLTSLSTPADRARGEAAGADSYLKKPFNPAELLEVVARLS